MSSTSRQAYHTHVKLLVRSGSLPAEMRRQIPRSNLYRWSHEKTDKYCTLGMVQHDALTHAFVAHKGARKIFSAYVRLIKIFISLAQGASDFHSQVRANSKQVVAIINRVKPLVRLKNSLRLFNISVATFRNWSLQSHTACFESLTGSCNRVFHQQLSKPEVCKIKELMCDVKFQYWPVSSIALHALRNNILPVSLNTWYKYVHKLGLVRLRPDRRRKKNTIGIRAERPHQLWHADITVFVTADRIKQYIYLVIDNFSRKILAWRIEDCVKTEFRMSTIEEALQCVNQDHGSITLITDGGPENNLKSFLTTLDQSIEQRVALVDVDYSNSLIEAHNKIIKYNYLYKMPIADRHQLRKVFSFVKDDFNNRPHISLAGLTPTEAEQNKSLDRAKLKLYTHQATEERKIYNKTHHCKTCKD